MAGTSIPAERELHSIQLHVPSMHCVGCLNTIRNAASQVSGVETVEGDLADKTVVVHYWDGQEARDEIRHAIHDAGFPVG